MLVFAAGLVLWLDSGWPDILIGLLIAGVVIRSAARITGEAYGVLKHGEPG